MAITIPPASKRCPRSERLVFQKLERELPDDWIVLHSLGLPGHETKIHGEADFVILCPLGVFVVEVKGGKVSCQDGLWTYSGDFPTFTKKESPWSQAMTALGAVRNSLRKQDSRFKTTTFGYGVMMPFTEFTTRGAEILPEVLFDRRAFRQSSETYIRSLASYWRNELRARQPDSILNELTSKDLKLARRILRPDAETAFSLGTYLTGIEEELIYLTNRQIKVARRMAANPRTVVRGAAGTGKTVIALDRARKLAESGKRVLYLCYNKYLAAYVRKSVTRSDESLPIDVFHVHALYHKLIEDAGLAEKLSGHEPDHLFQRVFPDVALEAIITSEVPPWDVLVIDEAQDLLMPSHLDIFDLLLADGLRSGTWHIFMDPMQNIFGGEIEDQVEKRLLESNPVIDELFENCRNTKSVAIQTSIVSGIDVPVEGAIDGPGSEIHYFKGKTDFKQKIEDVLQDLMDKNVKPNDIVILSSRKFESSFLSGENSIAGRRIIQPSEKDIPDSGGLLFCTMQSFKGLERKVVLAIDIDEIGDEAWSMLHYAGLSRARTLLHIFLSRGKEDCYDEQSRSYGLRLANRPS